MEKKEVLTYAITLLSLVIFAYLAFSVVTNIPNIANKGFYSLTGNIVLDIENNFKIGDSLKGNMVVTQGETEEAIFGLISLTKNNEPIITETFNLKDVSNEDKNSGIRTIKIEELIDYRFEEAGDYELFFSVLDLDINIKKRFVVK